jgi:hypothetical protein
MEYQMSLDSDIQVLRRYSNLRRINPEDRAIVDRLSSIGLLKRGLDLDSLDETAKTTPLGKMFFS